jgi:type I restriction enzyme S subunit
VKAAWKNVALGEVARVFNGKTPSKAEQRSEGHPVLKIRDVSELGEYRGKFESFVDAELAAKFSEKRVCDGDTLILNAAHNADYVASKTYYAQPPTFGALATGEWLIVRPGEKSLDGGFVHHWVISVHTRRELRELVNGIHLYPKDVARLKIPLPPLAEQRRIAEVLDRAEALRAKRRAALAELDSLTQSLFLDLFGDPVTNPKGFIISRMGDVCDVRDGTHDSPKYVSEGGYPLVTSKNLSGGFVDLSDVNLISEADYIQINKRSKVDRGDIIMPMIGTIGSPVLVEGEPRFAIKNVALIKFTEDSPSPVLVRHLLSCSYFDYIIGQKNRGGTQKFVSLGDLRALPLLVPPIALQQEFARRVGAVEKLKAAQRTALAEQDALFATLQHRAFRGEL